MPAEDLADDLYALPAEEFVAARDALARGLAREGRKEDARTVRALRRPSRSAAALNHLARAHGDELRRLLDQGAAMRRALGKGERGALDQARAAATGEIGRLAAGVEGGEAVHREVAESLWAAVADDDLAATLLTGRLERPLENPGLAGLAGLPAPPPRPSPAPPKESAAQIRRRRQAEERVERARARVADSRGALERAEDALQTAEHDLAALEQG